MNPIVDQIKQHADQHSEVGSFYRCSLRSIAGAVDAVAAVAWNCTSLPYRIICQTGQNSELPVRVGISPERHVELLQRAHDRRASELLATSDPVQSGHAAIVVCPVQRGSANDLFEFFLPAGISDAVRRIRCAEIERACEAVSQTLANSSFSAEPINCRLDGDLDSAAETETALDPRRLHEFTLHIHQSIDHSDSCCRIANEIQSLLQVDRVTVLDFQRNAKTVSVSGMPKINRRSNAIRNLEKLACRVLKSGQTLWYPAATDAAAPQIQGPLDTCLGSGVTRSVVVLPIFERDPLSSDAARETTPERANPVIGGIVCESFTEQWSPAVEGPAITAATAHAATAFRNSHRHRSLFLYPLWNQLGKLRRLTAPGILPRSLAVLAIVMAVVAALILIPARFEIRADGKLLPETRRNIWAPAAGQVEALHVRNGSRVQSGQLLVSMSSSELDSKMTELESQIDIVQQQIESLNTRRLTLDPAPGDREAARSDVERASLAKQQASLEQQQAIYAEQLSSLQVSSPITGQVSTTDLYRRLMDRPVDTGRLLMEIADTDGAWIVELDVPDRRIGHLQRALANSPQPLPVSLILSADPGRRLQGTVESMELATRTHPGTGQSVRVTVRLNDQHDLDIRQIRTHVSARIDCGSRSLGAVWLNDLGEFVSTNILFNLW